MNKKVSHEPPADDWAGLAQNLFGIDLEKPGVDDDLLDEDMFKVELPKLAEPAAAEPVLSAAPAAEAAAAAKPDVAAPPPKVKPKPAPQSVSAKSRDSDDSFGIGILEEADQPNGDAETADEGLALPEDFDADGLTLAADFDDGLTLPPDHETEGLTLPADYDDGLTLAPEAIATGGDLVDSDEDEEDEDDTDDLSADISSEGGEVTEAARPDRPRRRMQRRTREDAYWDMLENWEWEEIPEDDSPRGEGDRSRPRRGDRDRRGRGGDRGGRERGREDRPHSPERSSSEDRPRREVRRPPESPAPAQRGDSGESSGRPRRRDRSPDERGSRGERQPPREERRDEPRKTISPPPAPIRAADDFGCGIFEEQASAGSPTIVSAAPAESQSNEEVVAQSSQAADTVLRDASRSSDQSVVDEVVWSDDDSDVSPAPAGSVVEAFGLPAAEAAGESDRMVSASDVEPLEGDDRPRRRPRRRRRRSSSSDEAAPPDGNEGTTFDLSEALSAEGETLDFIPSTSADDSAVSAESEWGEPGVEGTTEARPGERRGGRRRRRRRFRPGDDAATEADVESGLEPQTENEVAAPDQPLDDEPELKPITYSNIPSWEEAIRYLLQPHLVGRNLGPDDGDEDLASDPRGSGGAEPTPPPPPPRRRRGGGGRGRRP